MEHTSQGLRIVDDGRDQNRQSLEFEWGLELVNDHAGLGGIGGHWSIVELRAGELTLELQLVGLHLPIFEEFVGDPVDDPKGLRDV